MIKKNNVVQVGANYVGMRLDEAIRRRGGACCLALTKVRHRGKLWTPLYIDESNTVALHRTMGGGQSAHDETSVANAGELEIVRPWPLNTGAPRARDWESVAMKSATQQLSHSWISANKRRSWERKVLRDAMLPDVSGTRPATLKSVLRAIDEYCQLRDGECYASQEKLASETGISVSTVRRSLKALETLGLITCQRKSRGGRATCNHYRIVWSELALLGPQHEQPVISNAHHDANDCSPHSEQPVIVPPSNVHGDLQNESETREKTTTAVVVDSLTNAIEELKRLVTNLAERISSLGERSPESVSRDVGEDWRTLERELAEFGVRYPSKAIEASRRRGETVHDVRSIVHRDGVSAKDVANRLIHGTKLPEPRAKRQAEPPTAESLWETFCSFCRSKQLDRTSEIWRFESAIERNGLEMPQWAIP